MIFEEFLNERGNSPVLCTGIPPLINLRNGNNGVMPDDLTTPTTPENSETFGENPQIAVVYRTSDLISLHNVDQHFTHTQAAKFQL